MAKFGIGAATVDLRLDRDAYRLGETVSGSIRIEGGNVEQRISNVSVLVMMKAYIKGQEVTRSVQTIPVVSGFVVQPKPYVQEIPFHYPLPNDLAISTPHIQYFLHTKLDVEQAADPTDMDRFTILPPANIAFVLRALERLDFRQKPDSGKLTTFGQEFSFFPGRPMSVPLQELEIIFFDTSDGLRLLLELDVRQSGMFRREKERKVELLVAHELLAEDRIEELCAFLIDKIEFYLANPDAVPYFSMTPNLQGGYGSQRPGMGGMIGGMAAGLLGGLLLSEMMEGAGGLFGTDEASGAEDGEDPSGDDGGFDDFGGGGFDDF